MRRYAIWARMAAGVMLIIVWGLFDSPLWGVIFLLALLALSAARYRLSVSRWLGVAEAIVCAAFAFYWPFALLGLWLPVIGLLEDRWALAEAELLRRAYDDRGALYRLEENRAQAEREMRNAARYAELSERTRIAQEIHDHVGHEISGALIALQTAMRLYEKGDTRAGELLSQSVWRLETASEHLRETVHNLKPARVTGPDTMLELCDAFTFCPVHFERAGELGGTARWELLEANLKEALTNVSRHSNATEVSVRLDGNERYIRLTVSDNGTVQVRAPQGGIGITGMRERVRSAGGTFSLKTDGGFTLVTILPKE